MYYLFCCIAGSSWIPGNTWPAWHQGTQSECIGCLLIISRKVRWLCFYIWFPNSTCANSFRVIQVLMVQREKPELLAQRYTDCFLFVNAPVPVWFVSLCADRNDLKMSQLKRCFFISISLIAELL